VSTLMAIPPLMVAVHRLMFDLKAISEELR
jgi:hypothetical protein